MESKYDAMSGIGRVARRDMKQVVSLDPIASNTETIAVSRATLLNACWQTLAAARALASVSERNKGAQRKCEQHRRDREDNSQLVVVYRPVMSVKCAAFTACTNVYCSAIEQNGMTASSSQALCFLCLRQRS
jgi:hypothetical protein